VLLEVTELTSGYGAIPVLHEVSLAVDGLETVCVLGANGAGKTTLVNTIAGVLRPSSGRVRFEGEDVTGLKPEQLAARGLSLVRQGRSVFPYMTVQENLDVGAYLVRDPRRTAERLDLVFETFPALKDRRQQVAGSMSGGEQKMVEIARSLMLPLKLLILDEPSLGLAPLVVELIFDRIGVFNRSGLAVLLVEQNALGALRTASRGYVLELGRVRVEGTSERLAENPEIQAAYLGIDPT
jgi:branched-chain amino acid transport system ATP-binding protein